MQIKRYMEPNLKPKRQNQSNLWFHFKVHGSKYYLYGSKEFFPYIIGILKAKKCIENIMQQEAPSTLFLTSKVNTYTDNAKYKKMTTRRFKKG
jgi:hypothetical protein